MHSVLTGIAVAKDGAASQKKGGNSEIFQLAELLWGSVFWSLHCLGEECAVSLLHC